MLSREERKRKRKSRWGGEENDKAFIPGMPTVIPANLDRSQERAYLLQLQIEELSRRLRTGELGIPQNPEDRSPSPEPIYNNEGKRLNTREYRTRRKLEDERHSLISEMMHVNTDYKPPVDYKPPIVRVSDKVMIPQDEHPEINFVGLLIGPRGNTLKSMEKETGAKIIIRGKGSVKEGKVGRKDGQPLPGEDEPLHAYVTANNPEAVKKAVEKIKEILKQGIEVPEGQNDLRRMQLRELALLNGTLRETEGLRCSNCGATTHKSWLCPDKPNITNNVICTSCGGAGHIAKDCREKQTGTLLSGANLIPTNGGHDKAKIDEEYMSLMAELGEGPPPKRVNMTGPNTSISQINILAPVAAIRPLMSAPVPLPTTQHQHIQPQQTLQQHPQSSGMVAPWQQSVASLRGVQPNVISSVSSLGVATTIPPLLPACTTAGMPPPPVSMMQPPWQQHQNILHQQQLTQVAASQGMILTSQAQQPTPLFAPGTVSVIATGANMLQGVGAVPTGTTNLLAQPPPPPPPQSVAAVTNCITAAQQHVVSSIAPASVNNQMIAAWTNQPQVMAPTMMQPWQQQFGGLVGSLTAPPGPVPPPRLSMQPASTTNMQSVIPPWQQMVGVPPPGVQQIPAGLAPPPTSTAIPGQAVDLNTLANLSGLLTAPPPPPPPPPS